MGAGKKKVGAKRTPPVPKSIPAGRWRTTRKELVAALEEPTRIRVEMIDRMILNLIEAESALEVARRDPIQLGPRGQNVEHPGFRIAARCESTALAIAAKLGVVQVDKKPDTDTKEAKPVERVEDELAAIRKRKASG